MVILHLYVKLWNYTQVYQMFLCLCGINKNKLTPSIIFRIGVTAILWWDNFLLLCWSSNLNGIEMLSEAGTGIKWWRHKISALHGNDKRLEACFLGVVGGRWYPWRTRFDSHWTLPHHLQELPHHHCQSLCHQNITVSTEETSNNNWD